ncbi:unnamed protein product [Lactuca saligna]|uniref:Uncharacterized protein n=1 Tax=Lactuca saligna TaxID=75948 RepID=A0AA35YN52_LACSI|nr:unnamed protein product [Lactuca saligna]
MSNPLITVLPTTLLVPSQAYETIVQDMSGCKIIAVKVTGAIETESFPNAMFKVAKGSGSQVHKFTFADLPCLNPYDWIMLYNYFKRWEMDVEITVVLRRKPFVQPKEASNGFEKLKLGKVYNEGWYVVFQARERNDAGFHKVCIILLDKHLYTTTFLEYILEMVHNFKGNSQGDKKMFF